ncbi:MAG: protein translocase subunit SecD [Candidatus Hydrogenedentota bacterium]
MKKHPYRALLIWALVIAALINIYPTIGWMTLPSDEEYQSLSREERLEYLSLPPEERKEDPRRPEPGTREARLEKWRMEDRDPDRRTAGMLGQLYYAVQRWAEFDNEMVITLGLDLQGGVHMVISFDWHDLPEEHIEQKRESGYSDADIQEELQEAILQQVRRRVHEFEAQEPVIQTLGDNQIQIQLPGEKDIERAVRLIKKTAQLNFHIVAEGDEARPVWRAVSEAFPEFPSYFNRSSDIATPELPAENYEAVSDTIAQARERGIIPEDKVVRFSSPPKPEDDQVYRIYLLEQEPIQTGEGLQQAMARPDQTAVQAWQIAFAMSNQAGQHFGEVTEENIGRRMAILVDNVVLSAPVIRDQITTSGVISGDFSGEEARDLAIALNSGSMAVPVHEEYTRVVGPSLGADSVRSGVTSAVVGIACVAVFMLLYYLTSGGIAIVALVLNAIFVIAAMAYFNLTLTLPGIAGLILTVGMAVDANVLIFERIREELRLGHSVPASITNGFDRAAVTILDANVTTLIAALVLMQFGTGPIQGFAVALSIGIVSSVFCALVVTRAMFEVLVRKEWLKKLTMLAILKPETQIPFMRGRVPAAGVSVLVVAVGMGMFIMRGQDNFGVDFTEGTNIEVTLDAPRSIPVGEVREALAGAGFESPVVQEIGGAGDQNHFLIRVGTGGAGGNGGTETAWWRNVAHAQAPEEAAETPEDAGDAEPSDADTDDTGILDDPEDENTGVVTTGAAADTEFISVGQRIRESLAALTPNNDIENVNVVGEQDVGPAVGKQLRYDALTAIGAALIFIIVYLWFRFELRFAVAAVIALAHDVIITVGLFALTGREISMPVIAAILTIIGYSLNDTIVVFDRVREDMQLYRGKGYSFLDILNKSINQTLARTLLTSITTLFVVVALFLFGGNAINDFAFALIIGVLVGSYSSVFVASSAAYAWQVLFGRLEQPGDTGEGKGKGKKKAKKQKAGESPA